jgi:hypothetical protein
MTKPIHDRAFGKLEFNGSWVREIKLTFVGMKSTVELIVEGNDENESIREEQRMSYQKLSEIVPRAEAELFKFYESICDGFRTQFGEEADTRMPKIKENSDLAKLVKLTGVVFPMVMEAGEISVGFLLECSWDPEHGLSVKITNGEAEIGTQDILT